MVIDLNEILYLFFNGNKDEDLNFVLNDKKIKNELDRVSDLINKKLEDLEDPSIGLESILYNIINKEIEEKRGFCRC